MRIIETLNNGISGNSLDIMTNFFEKNEGKTVSIELKRVNNQRSVRQNSAMHLWFTQVSEEMNDVGVPLVVQIGNREKIERPWNALSVKNLIFRPVMEAITDKKSTTQLERGELDKVLEPIMKWLAEDWMISIPFPSEEELALQSLINF